jgi:succinate dehydrogenase / fumarate reductase cytochrome b subunit
MSASATTSPRAGHASFLGARLASILAVAPLGVWTAVHLWNNLAAFNGAEAWSSSVTEYKSPVAQLVTGIVVLVPLAVHTVWGVGRLFTSRPNNGRYHAYGNLKYLLQRVAGLGVLAFLGAHLWLAMIHPRLSTGRGEAFEDIAREMHFHRPTLVVYLLGTLGVAYHLANGLQTAAMGWGLVTSRAALKRLESVVLVIFFALLAMAWAVIYALYDAGGAFGPLTGG